MYIITSHGRQVLTLTNQPRQAQASSETTNDEEKTRATAAISAAKELDIWQHAQPLEA